MARPIPQAWAALSPEQRAVLATIKQVAAKKGASPKQIKAAIETGLVESGLRNLSGGDADSAGWRQERASLYDDPTNLRASVGRFFDETAPLRGKYGSAGDLAAAVQRPAAQYRGRYQEQSGRADQLLNSFGAKATPQRPQARTTTTTPGVDNSAARGAAIAQFLGDKQADPVTFAMQVRGLRDTPGTTTTVATPQPKRPARPQSRSGDPSEINELFWQGRNGINVKDGRKVPQGFVPGHKDHVHAAGSPETIIALGKLAKSMGLRVGENPYFTGQAPAPGVHTPTSNHYKIKNVGGRKVGQAIDVSGDPKMMAHFAATAAHRYGFKVHG
jgi:hypothetical protein